MVFEHECEDDSQWAGERFDLGQTQHDGRDPVQVGMRQTQRPNPRGFDLSDAEIANARRWWRAVQEFPEAA